jgi:hypothetical protein
MTAEPVEQVFTAGIPFALSAAETTARQDDQSIRSESTEHAVAGRQVPTQDRSHSDPRLAWLARAEARQYEGHWVALDPDTGEFLGLADSRDDLRRWRERDVSVLFVEPQSRRTR